MHIVLRSRPDIVAGWSNEEVALRNMRLQGKVWFQADGSPRRTAQAEMQRITYDPIELARIRRKLSDLSSLMAYFDEYIAKHANAEDEVKGAFWEGVFGCELIEDEASLLACMAYVDLNPIRAMLAQSLEESDHTGAFERIHELRQQLATGELSAGETTTDEMPGGERPSGEKSELAGKHEVSNFGGVSLFGMRDWERRDHARIGWLAPIEIDETGSGLDRDAIGRRPSRKGFLPISLLKYLEIVEWAGRQQRPDKPGSIPNSLKPIFERVGFGSTGFLESMTGFAKQEKFFKATERRGQADRSFAKIQIPEAVKA
jgi:hypothetical protein